MPKVGDSVGRFELRDELGRGPMSEVFLAIESDTSWKVAIKFFLLEPGSKNEDHPMWAARMLREARAAAAFVHDSVVRVHEVGAIDGAPYLVRDFIEGRSLAQVAIDPTPGLLPWKIHWVRELARTLADIHRAGLVHRDVKPSNALVRRDGALRLLDFGVARRSIDRAAGMAAPISERLRGVAARAPRTIGTPAYTAPERFGNEPSSPATDQFGWGVVAHEVLTGRLPWGERDAPVKIVEALLTQPPPSARAAVPELRPAVDAVLARAMAKVAAGRFATMDDAVRAFDDAIR